MSLFLLNSGHFSLEQKAKSAPNFGSPKTFESRGPSSFPSNFSLTLSEERLAVGQRGCVNLSENEGDTLPICGTRLPPQSVECCAHAMACW